MKLRTLKNRKGKGKGGRGPNSRTISRSRTKSRCREQCQPKPEYKDAYDGIIRNIRSPHTCTLKPGRSSGCDLYIDIEKNPHIHIYEYRNGKGNGTYYISITGKDIYNKEIHLPSVSEDGYKSVLTEMYNDLEGTHHVPVSFQTPEKSRVKSRVYNSISRPEKTPFSKILPMAERGIVPTKLGPTMALANYSSLVN